MQVNSKQTGVYPEICGTRCETCMAPECQICQRCLTADMKHTLESAYLEHINRHECRRVFPPPMVSVLKQYSVKQECSIIIINICTYTDSERGSTELRFGFL